MKSSKKAFLQKLPTFHEANKFATGVLFSRLHRCKLETCFGGISPSVTSSKIQKESGLVSRHCTSKKINF